VSVHFRNGKIFVVFKLMLESLTGNSGYVCFHTARS
jgi:hypothetical protein